MISSWFNQRRAVAVVAAGLVVSSFLPARREAVVTQAPRHALALLLAPVSQRVYSLSLALAGPRVENRETLEAVLKDRDDLQVANNRLQADLDEARQEIAALSHLRQVLPINGPAVQFIQALVTGATEGPGYPRLEINRGRTSGVGERMIVVSGQYLVGRVSDVGPTTATVALITSPADTVLSAYIVSPRAAEAGGRKVEVNLSVGPGGQTFVTSDDVRDGVEVGDVAYVVDNAWPEAKGFVIGRVESVERDPARPLLMQRIVVRPEIRGLTRVTVVAPLAEAAPRREH